MSYAYFARRGRSARDLGRAAIRSEVKRITDQRVCGVVMPEGWRCGCQAVAATLDKTHVCKEHLMDKIELKS